MPFGATTRPPEGSSVVTAAGTPDSSEYIRGGGALGEEKSRGAEESGTTELAAELVTPFAIILIKFWGDDDDREDEIVEFELIKLVDNCCGCFWCWWVESGLNSFEIPTVAWEIDDDDEDDSKSSSANSLWLILVLLLVIPPLFLWPVDVLLVVVVVTDGKDVDTLFTLVKILFLSSDCCWDDTYSESWNTTINQTEL